MSEANDVPDVGRTVVVRQVIWDPGTNTAIEQVKDTSTQTADGKIISITSTGTGVNASSTITGNGAPQHKQAPVIISFDRKELDAILRVYGFKVADGEWKDYAIDLLKDRAVFSVYRRAHDVPLHCIEKIPALSRKQGMYSVTGSDGRILKRGHELEQVLRILEKKPKLRLV